MSESDPTQTPPPDAALSPMDALCMTLADMHDPSDEETCAFDREDGKPHGCMACECFIHVAALTARVRELETPPPDAALPVEVEECPMDCEWSREQAARLRAHIAALAAQNAALRGELEAAATRARIEALAWALNGENGSIRWVHEIEAEIAHLKAQGEASGGV